MIQGVAAEWSFSPLSANKGVNQLFIGLHPLLCIEMKQAKKAYPTQGI